MARDNSPIVKQSRREGYALHPKAHKVMARKTATVVLAAVHARDLAPFRATDHEPEVMYVRPTTAQLPFGWKWRHSGIGLVHQSNGQSKPRRAPGTGAYLMTGIEPGQLLSA